MIRNFIANGCSFTESCQNPETEIYNKTWATYLAQELGVENHVNLASSGAGNDYICQSTVNYIETHKPDPATTLVVIMWSGLSRIDVPISQHWYNHFKPIVYSVCKSDGISHWASSGGAGGSWQMTSLYKEIFGDLYKIIDPVDQCMHSLRTFIMLESYLKSRGYKFLFTSFINYWTINPVSPLYSKLTGCETYIERHCKNQPIYQNFDFSNWFFINNNRDCIGEFAWDPVLSKGDTHPSEEMHQRFAQEILLPRVQQIHM